MLPACVGRVRGPDPVEAVYSHDQPAAEEIEQNEHALAKGRGEQDVGLHEEREQGRVAVGVALVGRLARVHVARRVAEHVVVDVGVFGRGCGLGFTRVVVVEAEGCE